MAGRAADPGNPGRRVCAAAAGCRRRPHPFGSCAGNVGRSGRAIARGVTGAGAVRPRARRDSEPARGVDPHRQYAIRSRPALFASADHAIAAADQVHADGVGRGAVRAAGRRRLVPALGDGMGTRRRRAVAAVRRRPYRGSHQAGLPRHPRPSRTHAADPGAGAGAGAVVTAATGQGLVPSSSMFAAICEPHPEELAKQASRRMDATRELAAILRDAAKTPLLRMRSERGVRRDDVSGKRRACLLIPRIEIVAAGYRGRGHAFGARAVRAAAPAREALALAAVESAGAAADLRLRSGDERRQPVDAGIIRNHRLRLRLGLRLELRLRAVLARLVLVARLIGLALALVIARIVVARHERLLLHRDEAGLLAEMRKALALVLAILGGHLVFGTRLRLVLAELFLGGGDQAEIMLGVLIIVLGGDRIAGRARVARQLNVFFGDVRSGAADLDVGPVRFEHPGHRILAAPVVVIAVVVVVPVTHPLVVLTVSHVLPLFQP